MFTAQSFLPHVGINEFRCYEVTCLLQSDLNNFGLQTLEASKYVLRCFFCFFSCPALVRHHENFNYSYNGIIFVHNFRSSLFLAVRRILITIRNPSKFGMAC